MTVRSLALAAALLALGAGQAFEDPPAFRASAILRPENVKGANFTVAEDVTAEGFFQDFSIASDFGAMTAEGRTMLRTRLVEVDALARLSEVSKTQEFAKAAGGAVLDLGKGVARAVQDPAATVKGVGAGIKRFGINLGRQTKRAAASVTDDDHQADDPDKSGGDKALDAAGGAAYAVFGVNGAARAWAKKLGVDPYTTNPVLHQALVDMGKIDASGRIAANVLVPIPMVLSTTATVGDLVWSADPEEVRKENEKRLAALPVAKDVAGRFFTNANYTLTGQTRLIAALYAVRVKGCADYVAAAAEAGDQREALFFVESAEMLAGLHSTEKVTAVLEDSRAMIAVSRGRAVALLPFDWLRWTELLQKTSTEIGARAKKELRAGGLEVHLSGQASPAAKEGLKAVGWSLRERVRTGLVVLPAD